MARKSRKVDYVNVGSEALLAENAGEQEQNVFRAALYARLSFESDANRERNTIETQMELLKNFVADHHDIVVEKEYYDISKTGTNFDREGFDEMMQDVREGKINCVIVKDLSRLGRNYVEAGSYVERVFPFFEVRFISVNDHYDSSRDDADLLISMSNIYNEYYSRDLAKKIKASYRTSWENGEYPSGVTAYGYEKDKDNPHQLVPDTNVSGIVQRIFKMFLDGETYASIVRIFNEEGIPTPKAYKRLKSGRELGDGADWRWGTSTVKRIIVSRYYVGDSVHNQFINDSFAAKKQKPNPKENWIIIENTHEPLISREDFEKAQEKVKSIENRISNPKSKGEYSTKNMNFFKNKIVCGECGKTMYLYGKNGNFLRFNCGNHVLNKMCFSHPIAADTVNDYVLRVIRTHINVYMENVDMVRRLNNRQESMKKYDVFSREIRKCRKELEKLAKHREQLFEDYVCKLIDAEQYELFAKQDSETEKEIQNDMEKLLKHKVGYEKNFHTEAEWETIINKYRNTRTLTKSMIDAFVEKVIVAGDGSLTVQLVYDDMLQELIQYAKERESELS